jgi:putative hydrolase of the HAD superfamily
MTIQTIFFDLDETLYSPQCGLWNALRERMDEYMQIRMNIPPQEVPIIRKTYFEMYGTTLRGLQKVYGVDAQDYLAYVHQVDLKQFIHPDPELRKILLSLKPEKAIFTNADRNHARRVLSILGVEDLFSGIIDINDMEPYCKPMSESFRIAMEQQKVTRPENCLLIDDSIRNTSAARKSGMRAVLVNNQTDDTNEPFTISDIHQLPTLMPEILEGQA